MLYSVSKYVQAQLNGLAMPAGIPGPLVCHITPPVWERMKEPRAYVWGGRLNAARQTAPRGPGYKRFPWLVDVYLVYLDMPDDALANEPYPQIIDAVMTQFGVLTMPVWINASGVIVGGPQAGATQIQAIGEVFDLNFPPEKLASYQRMIWYSALLSVEVLEVVQS